MKQPCVDDEGYLVACAEQPSEQPPATEHPNAWAIGFFVALIVGLLFVEWKTRPKTGRRSPSRFLKKYAGKWWLIGVAGFALLGWHLFRGGPL